uniref:EB domain-containing protein n=1 Tax=Anopheles atroparvus TaxID=41427 RepID=A0AAG5DHF1_ANOAO
MIVSFFPDSVWGCTVKQHQKQKHLLYHKIIYALISDKYKNRNLRKSSFALLYLSYVFIKMLPVTLAIESHTGTKAITSLTAKPRAVPDLVAPPLGDEDDDYIDDYVDEYDIVNNKSAKGRYIGAPCEFTCHSTLHHVYCDPTTNTCTCEKDYAVVIGILKGCAKPKKLGEQCFYDETCIFNDEHALCQQIVHNAICQCAPGFHSVSYSKPKKRVFCTQDMASITADLPTLFSVTSGIAVLAGLICMVLHLFSKTKYPRPRHFGDANLAPPILFSSDTGIPLTIQSARPSSRSSQRSSGSIGSYGNRRSSSAPLHGSKGVLVSTSRTGSRRPSLASVHSTSSSVRSYSMRRFEQEIHQKELRQEMKRHLARLQEQQQLQKIKPNIIIGEVISCPMNRPILTTPSPMTPNSVDDILPSVDETQEFSPNLSQRSVSDSTGGCFDGPCSSTELLK